MAGAFPHVWSHAFGAVSPTQKSADPEMFVLFKNVLDGDIKRDDSMLIVLLDEKRQEAVRWNLRNAWPAKWTGPDLKANANEIAIETLELAHEGLERQ